MVFSSTVFLFIFLPVFLLAVLLIRNTRAINLVLLILSLIFYAWGEPIYVLLMIGSVGINYLLALPAARLAGSDSVSKRLLLCFVIAFNIGLLCLFKYAGFAVETVNGLFGLSLGVPDIKLPIGISFFTFQTMSYVIDAYRGTIKVQRNPAKLLLYVCFFPQLIAGPIVKYRDIETQLDNRTVSAIAMTNGIRRFIIGLSKKLIIANTVGSIADAVFSSDSGTLCMPLAWLAALCYCLQIYFDFSGYSDMAIGLGKMAGFDFLENFNYPFTACSMQDFWRRWHISLSTWFKEYVYIPLGGNRKGKWRTGINKVIVFFLTGLWHGAQWTFVVWGLFHGLFLLLESYGVINPSKWRFKPLKYIYTLLVVTVAFVIFRAESFAQAFLMLKTMFAGPFITSLGAVKLTGLLTISNIHVIAIALVACTPLLSNMLKHLRARSERAGRLASGLSYAASGLLFLLCIISVSSSTYNPFIYFRF